MYEIKIGDNVIGYAEACQTPMADDLTKIHIPEPYTELFKTIRRSGADINTVIALAMFAEKSEL